MNKKTIFIVISLLLSVFALAGCASESVEPFADQITPSIQPTQNNLVREKSGPGGICGGIAGLSCVERLTCYYKLGSNIGTCIKSEFQPSPSILPSEICGDGTCSEIEKFSGNCEKDCDDNDDDDNDDEIECTMTPGCAPGFDIVDKGIDENGCHVYGCENNNGNSSSPNASNIIKTMPYEKSPFGVFSAFEAGGFQSFNKLMNFSNEGYLAWAEKHFRNIGAHWTRSNMQLHWNIIEPNLDEKRDWNKSFLGEQVIKPIYHSENKGHWLGVISSFTEGTHDARKYPNEFKAFIKAVVERYDGDGIDDVNNEVKIKYWQVLNEIQDFAGGEAALGFGVPARSAQEYAQYVRAVRSAAIEADPEAKIVLIAPTSAQEKVVWLEDVIAELAPDKEFDVLDIHDWNDANNWKMPAIAQYRTFLDSKGLTDVEIWSTENGTWVGKYSGGNFNQSNISQTEKDQANFLIKRYVYNLSHGLDKLFWNNLVEWYGFGTVSPDSAETHAATSYYDSMGLISDGQGPEGRGADDSSPPGTERLSYYSYKLMTDKLTGSDWKNIEVVKESNGVYIYKFVKNGTPIWVAWNENGGKTISLAVGNVSTVKVTEAIPNYATGKEVTDYKTAFRTETKFVSNGKVMLMISENPIYAE